MTSRVETQPVIAAHSSAEEHWNAVVARNPRFDGLVFYAVRSTGIFCKPSCPSRRPRRDRVEFFFDPAAAERAGYRACRRCRPTDGRTGGAHIETVRRVCRYIEQNLDSSLSLQELGVAAGVSPFHLQRLFKQQTGITPRQYVEARRLAAFKLELRLNGREVADATYEAGYGSSSRIYEKAAAHMGMTPAKYRGGGAEARIGYTVVNCTLGHLLLAATEKGICGIRLGASAAALERELFAEYPKAAIERDDARLRDWVGKVLEKVDGAGPPLALPLDIQVTAFQKRVYEELKRIPRGETRSYGQIAASLGMPAAQRAVARACATNPVALVIPCHRVVRADGELGGYRWGAKRKQQLLASEQTGAD